MSILTSIDVAKPVFAGKENGNTDNNGKHNGWYKGDSVDNQENVDQNEPFPDSNDKIEEEIKDSLEVIGSKGELFYATTGGDVYIHIYISNPDQFEILSFTLNGEKYSSYMFEPGSTQELLILKRNVGDVSGIVEYTIDQIKYVDGTEIKDVKIEGDKTVEAGIRTENQVTASIFGVQIGTNSISFSADLTDNDGLIAYSKGVAKAVLYDGDTLVAEKTLSVGANSVTFDGLTNGKVYQYAVVASYDNLTGEAIGYHMLAKEAFKTNNIVLFDNILVTQDGINFTFKWDDSVASKTITALKLYKDGKLVSELRADAISVAGLLSTSEYTIVADYLDLGKTASISLDFITLEKGVPNLSITNTISDQTSIGFEIAESDVDNVGQIAKIELVHANGTVVAENIDVRSFDNLLSDNSYTVKVTYVYDLSDGKGAQTVVASKEIKTGANLIPKISIVDVNSTQTSLTFDISEDDIDNVGSVAKIELVHANGTVVAENIDVRSFDNLLSDNSYTVKVTYVYDLSDGKGAQTVVKEKTIQTVAKVAPTIAIGNASTTSTSISGEYSITDTDSVLLSTKVELYLGSTLVATNVDGKLDFAGLTGGNLYTVKITCTYDLNDGAGTQTVTNSKDFEAASSGLAYTVTSSKICTVTGIGNCTDTELYIPSVIDGYRVTKIEEKAFENCASLTKIIIPDSVETIGKRAFYGCTALAEVTIPESVWDIGLDIFKGCTGLKTVYYNGGYGNYENPFLAIPSIETVVFGGSYVPYQVAYGVTNLKAVVILEGNTYIDCSAFEGCTNLTSVTIADSVAQICSFAFRYCTSLETIVLPKKLERIDSYAFVDTAITTITIPAKVEHIEASAFDGCTNLHSIYVDAANEDFCSIDGILYNDYATEIICIPMAISGDVVLSDSLTSIADYAFQGRTSLTSIVIPDSVTSIGRSAFRSCKSLTNVVIGNSVTSIGTDAFHECTSLTSIVIPDSVISIGQRAFYACDSLTSIVISSSVTKIDQRVFYGCTSLTSIAIPDSVTTIAYYAFYNCTSLTSVVIPNSVTSIGDAAFSDCSSLTSVVIGSSVTSIGSGAFFDCSSLTSVVIPDSVTSIGEYAFKYCSSLTSVVIGNNVTSIGDYAFESCSSLTSVVIGNSVTSIGEEAFYGCSSLTSIIIPDNVTSIGEYAFWKCTSLSSVVIGDSVTSIGDYAFSICKSLTSIVIGDSVTSIGDRVFEGCSSLTSVVIPDSVISIGDSAFLHCSSLASIKYRGTEDQWNAISKGTSWSYGAGNYTITYSYIGE